MVTPQPGSDNLAQECLRMAQLLQQFAVEIDGRLSVHRTIAAAAAAFSIEPVSLRTLGLQPSARLSLHCFGSFGAEANGIAVDSASGGKPIAVLKYLAARGGRPTPRDLLLEILWPGDRPSTSANRLRVAIHALRRQFGPMLGGFDLVVHHEGCYLLNPQIELAIDVDEFESLCREGSRLEREQRNDAAQQMYGDAERLYRGDFLEDDLSEDWTLIRRESLRDMYLDVLGRLAKHALGTRDYRACIDYCQKLVAQDNCREDAYALLMFCHATLHQRSRVDRWFKLCVAALRRELDASPSPRTTALHKRLMQSANDATADRVLA
jgi:DNA-binding SARP family transcriptional activator